MSEIDELRSILLNDFESFCVFISEKVNKRKFKFRKHNDILFQKAKDITDGKCLRLILNVAPRYGKTEIMVKMFIAWSLARNPSSRFIHLSYSDSLALDNSSEIKDIIQSDIFQEVFPHVKIKKDTKAKEKWYTTEGGGVLARSSSGQVTGFGAGTIDYDDEIEKFGGAIIIDDPIKPDDVNSDILRDKVNLKFDTTIRNRVNSRKTPIIIIMQRLHPQDLCGYILEKEGDDWEVITMPVINEDGTALCPSIHTISELMKMKEMLGTIFETQYLQNPEPIDGYLLPRKELAFLPKDHEEHILKRICFIDPSEKNGDMMSAIFVQVENFNDKLNFHIFDCVHDNIGFEAISEIVHKKALDYNVSEIIFEKNGVGLATGIKLKQLNEEKKYKITPYHSTENKEAKILNNFEFVKRHFSFNSDYQKNKWYSKFLNDLTTYSTVGRNLHKKDAMDVICSASKILQVMYKKTLFV